MSLETNKPGSEKKPPPSIVKKMEIADLVCDNIIMQHQNWGHFDKKKHFAASLFKKLQQKNHNIFNHSIFICYHER